MKNLLVFAVVFVSMFLISCDKDNVDDGDIVKEPTEVLGIDRKGVRSPGDQQE